MLFYHRSNYILAVMALFPDIGVDRTKFAHYPCMFSNINQLTANYFLAGYWKNPKNVRKFFTDLAEEKKYDPLVAENWYWLTHNTVLGMKVQNVICAAIIIINKGRKFCPGPLQRKLCERTNECFPWDWSRSNQIYQGY